ncbi:hypothetical protein KIW84_070576 [Lathyrus oleraceus]|uniref:RecA-like N-terminal domain-containing protein n=1 Tax=Pisum sativum TaxID=3888 RepID=A0A9D4VG19_PEA|nr:hypothetical protein KIW84_070576 [Pisum sativum]
MSKKYLALQQAMDQITSTFGKESIMWLGHSVSPKSVLAVSTYSFALDISVGIFGLPKGHVVEILGPEASGKTTLAWHVIAEAKKPGGLISEVEGYKLKKKKLQMKLKTEVQESMKHITELFQPPSKTELQPIP